MNMEKLVVTQEDVLGAILSETRVQEFLRQQTQERQWAENPEVQRVFAGKLLYVNKDLANWPALFDASVAEVDQRHRPSGFYLEALR